VNDSKFAYWKIKGLIFSLILVIIGLVLTWYTSKKDEQLVSFVSQIGSIFLITGAWSILYEIFLRAQFIEIIESRVSKVTNLIELAKQEKSFGLISIFSKSDQYDLHKFLLNNKALFVLLNDGRSWISVHAPTIESRLAKEDLTTTFILTHPKSDMVKVLAKKQEMSESDIRNKIKQFICSIKALPGYSPSKIQILGHYLYNPHSVFLGDERAIVTPYHASAGRRFVPLYIFENKGINSYYYSIGQDIDYLVKQSEDISTYFDNSKC